MFELYIITETTIKFILAIVIGYLLGKERKKHSKAVGSRTMSLICLGATLLAVISLECEAKHQFDFFRLIAYALPAISFMGAGVITKTRNRVDGLTTASTLWVIVPIGFLIGFGFYKYAFISSFLTWLVLECKYLRRKK